MSDQPLDETAEASICSLLHSQSEASITLGLRILSGVGVSSGTISDLFMLHALTSNTEHKGLAKSLLLAGANEALRKVVESDGYVSPEDASLCQRLGLDPLVVATSRFAAYGAEPNFLIEFGTAAMRRRVLRRLIREDCLDAHKAALRRLPEELGEFAQLRKLWLGRNNLTTLPKSIGALHRLEGIDLSSNMGFRGLPPSFSQLGALKGLSLMYAPLTRVPQEVLSLAALESLELTATSISELPRTFGALGRLKILGLRFNPLLALPPQLVELPVLEELSIDGSVLAGDGSSVVTLGKMKRLKKLTLTGRRTAEAVSILKRLQRELAGAVAWA